MSLDESEEINVIGTWWVPGRDQDSRPGALLFSKDEGPSLKLFNFLGFLTKPEDGTYTNHSFDEFFPIICGRTECGPATLIDFQRGQADFLIVGALFNSEDEATFRKIRLQFKHFPEWIRQTVIDRAFTSGTDDKGKYIVTKLLYQYRSFPEERFSANNLEFRVIFGLTTQGGTFTSITLTPKVYLEISSDTPKPITEWWFKVIRPMRDLLSLAIDRPIDITRLSIIDERDQLKPKECRVFFKGRRTNTTNNELTPEDMLFAKTDIQGNLGALVSNWFRMTKELPIVCNLYSSVTSIRELYLEEEFLSLAQAVEVYHRSRFNKKINLQVRLEEFLELLEPTTTFLVADKKGFATTIKNTRNYFTHWSENKVEKAASDSELFFVSTTLRYLIAASLLIELGISSDKTAELFKRNHLINNFRLDFKNPISQARVGPISGA